MATDPKAQAAAQIKRIEESTGMTLDDFAKAVEDAGLEKHGEIVAHFKSAYGITHGHANLLAHTVRERLAGGPKPADDLLDAQYAGAKAALRPIYDELAAVAERLGDDVQKVVQKTGVSFRRKKQFALIQAPSAKRIQLGLNLDSTPNDGRIVEMTGMCTHKVDVATADAIDDDIAAWIRAAYERAG